jgi:TolA-binding protein
MEQNIAESHHLLHAWAWVEKNRKQVIIGVSAVAVVGLIIGYSSYARAAKEAAAGEALSQALFNGAARNGGADTGAQLLKVATDNSGTQSGAQALLLAAGALFTNGKYAEAQSSFDQFARDHSSSPLVAQALYGSGAALAAQGKLADAAQAYKNVVDRYPSSPVANQARYSQAAVLATEGKLAEAVALYEEVVRASMGTSLGNEAGLRADELRAKLPPPAAVPAVTTAPASNSVPAPK